MKFLPPATRHLPPVLDMRFLPPATYHLPAALVACFLLSSCMVGPDYQRPDTGLPAGFNEPTVTTGAGSIPTLWWTLYADDTLNALVQAGLANNTDVHAAVARVEEAEALLREARAVLFVPQVQGNANAGRARAIVNGDSVVGNGFALGLSTSFEIDLWGRLRRAERATRDQLAGSRYGRDTVALTVAASIARSYFAVRSLDSQIVASKEIEEAAGEGLDLAQKRARGGVQSSELSSLFSSGSQVWSIGAGLLGPILDGGRYAARTDQAAAQAKQVEAQYVRATQSAFRDVSDALSNVRMSADTETDLVEHLQQTRSALRLAGLRYRQGYSAYLEVLDAQRTLNDAQLAFIRNRQAYLSYTVDLMNALGGGWSPR